MTFGRNGAYRSGSHRRAKHWIGSHGSYRKAGDRISGQRTDMAGMAGRALDHKGSQRHARERQDWLVRPRTGTAGTGRDWQSRRVLVWISQGGKALNRWGRIGWHWHSMELHGVNWNGSHGSSRNGKQWEGGDTPGMARIGRNDLQSRGWDWRCGDRYGPAAPDWIGSENSVGKRLGKHWIGRIG